MCHKLAHPDSNIRMVNYYYNLTEIHRMINKYKYWILDLQNPILD